MNVELASGDSSVLAATAVASGQVVDRGVTRSIVGRYRSPTGVVGTEDERNHSQSANGEVSIDG